MSRIAKEVYHRKEFWGMYAYQYSQTVSDYDVEHGIYEKGEKVTVYLTDEHNEVSYFDTKEEAKIKGSGEKDERIVYIKDNMSI